MTQQDMVTSVFSKLSETFASIGLLVTDEEKGEQVAKLLGLVKGVRKVGGLAVTDTGLVFIGINPNDLAQAKENAEMQADIDRLEAQIATRRAKLNEAKQAA